MTFSLLLPSIFSMMMRLLLDVSICFCPTPEPLLVVQSTSLLPYFLLNCLSISSVVFLSFFSHWYNAFAGSRSLPILDTWLNQFSLRSAILSTSVVPHLITSCYSQQYSYKWLDGYNDADAMPQWSVTMINVKVKANLGYIIVRSKA